MGADTPRLGRIRTAFAVSAAIAIFFNTVIACTKDAYSPLKFYMASLSNHDWTTQGVADVILFFGLGLILLKSGWIEKIKPSHVISLLVGAAIVAGVGLFSWYVLY